MQTITFNKIEGKGYGNTVSTGNLQKSVIAWTKYFIKHDKAQIKSALNYSFLIISFSCGAIVSAVADNFFNSYNLDCNDII